MASNGIYNYNRKEALKRWEPIPNMDSDPEIIQYFNDKTEIDGLSIRDRPEDLFDESYKALKETDVHFEYIKHVVLMHMNYIIKYIENQGVFLGNIKWNIRTILNEIINDEVDEEYYRNTKEIYEDILNIDRNEADVYELLDQAIKRENWRMVYYLIFWEDEEMSDRLSEVNKDYKCWWGV